MAYLLLGRHILIFKVTQKSVITTKVSGYISKTACTVVVVFCTKQTHIRINAGDVD